MLAICYFSTLQFKTLYWVRMILITQIVLFLLFLLPQTPPKPYAMCCVISRVVKQRHYQSHSPATHYNFPTLSPVISVVKLRTPELNHCKLQKLWLYLFISVTTVNDKIIHYILSDLLNLLFTD